MQRAVGIRQSRSDKISLKFLHDVDNEQVTNFKNEQR